MCLDLFAGSGALGMEALSRGAREVVFVDGNRSLIDALEANLDALEAVGGRCVHTDADRYLAGTAKPFDVVFLDPPFGTVGWADLCGVLQDGGWLAPGARVYIEDAAGAGTPVLPAGWELLRSASAGNVGYHLAAAPEGREDEPPRQER